MTLKCYQCGGLSGLSCKTFSTDIIAFQKECNSTVQSCITSFSNGGKRQFLNQRPKCWFSKHTSLVNPKTLHIWLYIYEANDLFCLLCWISWATRSLIISINGSSKSANKDFPIIMHKYYDKEYFFSQVFSHLK